METSVYICSVASTRSDATGKFLVVNEELSLESHHHPNYLSHGAHAAITQATQHIHAPQKDSLQT